MMHRGFVGAFWACDGDDCDGDGDGKNARAYAYLTGVEIWYCNYFKCVLS